MSTEANNRIKIFNSRQEAYEILPLHMIKTLKIGEDKFIIFRTKRGIFIMESTCPHMGQNMVEATITPFDEITCPWHSYRFNIHTGEEFRNRCRGMKSYPLSVENDGIFLLG